MSIYCPICGSRLYCGICPCCSERDGRDAEANPGAIEGMLADEEEQALTELECDEPDSWAEMDL